ncbi:hypothetical protein AAFN47_21630 [Hoeflea sp. CAU 1731]
MTPCECLDNLVGKPLTGVNHAADMAMIGFGKGPLVERRGKTIQLSEWDLHLQCPWRFVRDGSVILAWMIFTMKPPAENRATGAISNNRSFFQTETAC